MTKSTPAPRCSFCEKPERAVKKLIFGPEASICDECIEMCVDILEQSVGSHWRKVEAREPKGSGEPVTRPPDTR